MRKNRSSRFPDLTTIYRSAGMIKAQVIKSKLEGAGIPVLLDYESLGPVIGVTIDGLGEVRVLVPEDRAEEAKALIQEVPPSENPSDEDD
jgi:hypothetical protein